MAIWRNDLVSFKMRLLIINFCSEVIIKVEKVYEIKCSGFLQNSEVFLSLWVFFPSN